MTITDATNAPAPVPAEDSKTMEDKAVAAETKEDAPAPPAAGNATAKASDKKEDDDDAKAGTNKRKADALDESGGGNRPAVIARLKDATSVSDNPSSPTTPHIAPPEIWGRVMDFMPYEEVRSALLVGKIIANEAVKCVQTLNFMKGCQLDGPSTRRFVGVEEVNCLCLVSGEDESTVLCGDTAIRLVPLLTTFPKMKEVRIAGLVTEDAGNGQTQLVRRSYDPRYCSSPANHRDLAKVLCHSILGAFKGRLFHPALRSRGDIAELFLHSDICQDRNGEVLCKTCADVCACFPLKEILGPGYWHPCNDNFLEVLEVIAKREGARDVLRKHSAGFHSVISVFSYVVLLENAESEEEEALRRRLADLGVQIDQIEPPCVRYLTTDSLEYLDRLIAIGCDPSALSKEDLVEVLPVERDDRVFAKSTFDALVARGFALDEADLIVLDERMEPALKDLSAVTDNFS